MEKFCITGVVISFFCLMGAGAQIEFTQRQGSTILNTTNMEPRHRDVIDGVTKMQMANELPNFAGSPYLEKEFKKGTMKAIDGTLIPDLKYRYDIYMDRMEFIVNEDTAFIDLPLALEYVQIEERRFQYEVYMLVKDMIAAGYFEILYEGDFMSALCRRQIKLEQDVYVANYGGGGGTKEFKLKQEKFFFVRPGNSAAMVIENKKDLYRILPKYEQQIKVYLKENRISVRREDDFYRIVEYMDKLLKGI